VGKNILKFSKIEKNNIFRAEFLDFKSNNTIDFTKKKIAILYGPNGTGKTSLAKVLELEKGTNFEAEYNETDKNDLFHVIKDQHGRNIIKGSPKEFFLGENIEKEYNLKEEINKILDDNLGKNFPKYLKEKFNISTKTSKLSEKIKNENLKKYIQDIANKSARGILIKENLDDFIEFYESLKSKEILEINENKMNFLKNDYESKKSIISKLLSIKEVKKEDKVEEIEENEEALKILNRFPTKNECIVCDNKNFDRKNLIKKKKNNRDNIFQVLDKETKSILEMMSDLIPENDPFQLKKTFIIAITEGNKAPINQLITEIEEYFNIFSDEINNFFIDIFSETELISKYKEFKKLVDVKPKMEDEDIRFISKIINENIDKEIKLDRDQNKNLKILIVNNDDNDERELLETHRDEMFLSTGEQNFISLAFELLKAKNTSKKIIVLDDPISSFDSIYKNKIAFSIIKILKDKKQIILTHNTELIRLLYFQYKNCFNLYMFNNIENGENGFIPVNKQECEILLNINKLLDLFRNEIVGEIKDERLFLISMIPFMRGYANIIGNSHKYKSLSKVMHGYEKKTVDISFIYKVLFKKKISEVKYKVSVKDILNIKLNDIEILNKEKYPLLNKTLKHTLTYLFLRLKVEKVLIDKYKIDTEKEKEQALQNIINKAFIKDTEKDIDKRIFFTSRKTLLNEFNHFEGNMNIFQPAIDITDKALEEEKQKILTELEKIKNK
jgi:hypothetical protein